MNSQVRSTLRELWLAWVQRIRIRAEQLSRESGKQLRASSLDDVQSMVEMVLEEAVEAGLMAADEPAELRFTVIVSPPEDEP